MKYPENCGLTYPVLEIQLHKKLYVSTYFPDCRRQLFVSIYLSFFDFQQISIYSNLS